MTLSEKEIYALISMIISTFAAYGYVRDILLGKTKPHLFTWLVWGLSALIICVAMAQAGAGAGTWAVAFGAGKCLLFAALALKHGEKNITRTDWASFIACVFAIPLWLMTNDPMWSVIWLVGIEAVAFYPTFRKSVVKPFEETLSNYAWGLIQACFVISSLAQYSLTTSLYAWSVAVQNGIFILFVWWLRARIRQKIQ